MVHTLEEITKALKVIKEVCDEHNLVCEECPLRKSENDCAITDDDVTPREWEFYNPQNIKLIV